MPEEGIYMTRQRLCIIINKQEIVYTCLVPQLVSAPGYHKVRVAEGWYRGGPAPIAHSSIDSAPVFPSVK